jgi:hydrogenase nickel incorporation protein HypA/HybF
MHEASLMADLVRKIAVVAAAGGSARVARVSVWLGALSHMSADHFAEHFRHAAAGTLAEGAVLDISVSDEITHPDADHVVLRSVEMES